MRAALRLGLLLLVPSLLFSQITDPLVQWRADVAPGARSLRLIGNDLVLLYADRQVVLDSRTGHLRREGNAAAIKEDSGPSGIPVPAPLAAPLYSLKPLSAPPLLLLIYSDEMKAVRPDTFKTLWSAAFTGHVSAEPAANATHVFIPTKEGSLLAYDLLKGERRWEYFIGVAIPFPPQAAEDAVYVAGANDFLYGVSVTGRELWRHQCGPVAAPLLYRNGTLYALNKSGTLYAFTEHKGGQDLAAAVDETLEGGTDLPKQARVTNFLVKREIQRLAEQIASRDFRAGENHPAVAVLLMKDLDHAKTGLSEAFTDMLIEAFADIPKYTVVERARLNQIMEEQKLSLTGAVDPQTAIKLGRLVAANRIVTGSVASIGEFYELSARMVETETGVLIKSASVQVRKALVDVR